MQDGAGLSERITNTASYMSLSSNAKITTLKAIPYLDKNVIVLHLLQSKTI